MSAPKCNAMELMIVLASRYLEDGKIAVVGTGGPCAAAMLAQKTHAPNLAMLFEAGGVAPILPTMPVSVGDSRTYYKGILASTMAETMSLMQKGMVDYSFLGGAQIDAYGNLNSTQIGHDHAKPKVRLPGSGGANDLASLAWQVLVITPHEKRRFVEKVDFVTSPGYIDGPGARERVGLPRGTGPYRIVTNLGVMGFDEASCRMTCLALHAGVEKEQVIENTGFEMLFADPLGQTAPPTEEELRILRDEVDPNGYIIGR